MAQWQQQCKSAQQKTVSERSSCRVPAESETASQLLRKLTTGLEMRADAAVFTPASVSAVVAASASAEEAQSRLRHDAAPFPLPLGSPACEAGHCREGCDRNGSQVSQLQRFEQVRQEHTNASAYSPSQPPALQANPCQLAQTTVAWRVKNTFVDIRDDVQDGDKQVNDAERTRPRAKTAPGASFGATMKLWALPATASTSAEIDCGGELCAVSTTSFPETPVWSWATSDVSPIDSRFGFDDNRNRMSDLSEAETFELLPLKTTTEVTQLADEEATTARLSSHATLSSVHPTLLGAPHPSWQATELFAKGFIVKNTFLDVAPPTTDVSATAQRRSGRAKTLEQMQRRVRIDGDDADTDDAVL